MRATFIAAMRGVACPITVVTTDGPGGRHGATVSAFASVSADPPTVLVCLMADSRIAGAVTANGAFCVNVLDDASAAIADRFAGRHDTLIENRFNDVPCDGAPGEAPRIARATSFGCRIVHKVQSGSHLVVLGGVLDVRAALENPLTYRNGAYHRVVPHVGASAGQTRRARS